MLYFQSTFILLSYVKILNVSFDILTPGKRYMKPDGSEVNKQYWYYNGSLEYFGKDHVPYAVLAILTSLIFNVLPLALLILYPFRCFRKALRYLKLQSNMLNIFMDAFYGCYRTESRYYSLFAAVYILLRVINLLLYTFIGHLLYFSIAGYVFTLALVLVALIRPYRNKWHNLVDIMLLLSIVTYNQYVNFIFEITYTQTGILNFIWIFTLMALVLTFPAVYAFCVISWHLMPKRFINKLQNFLNHLLKKETEESLPHRIQQNESSPLIRIE